MDLEAHLAQWDVTNKAAAVLDWGDNAHAHGVESALVATAGDIHRVFELASVTKLLCAYGFLIAISEGVVELDTPCGPTDATVKHLLAHAAGVGFSQDDPIKKPEQRRIYSSYGFELLSAAVERETDIPFPEYLHEAVFAPLGMHNSLLHGSAGHGARSSVYDLTLFAREVLFPQLLDDQTVAQACHTTFPGLAGIVPGYGMYKPCDWGLGFEIKGAKNPHWTGQSMPSDVVGHFGQSGTYMWLHRPSKRAMIALTDRAFGPWAKEVWGQTNDHIWQELTH
ncbi:class C beta-lactamase-related serine hydrolase [Corynebacterium sp. sy017]|uniref:serine hydrolase domain-containing protein n=1 Tax=unclassified Corynebacterium TaxID=2624378 RepID=UPI0011856305|nr:MULTISPECIES: serine hydrolase [unclassified Corynebacterium]MBP3088040.1 class C beta-lactamase-related serine hydrolase [Corynebacterium sp. sy017]TSD92568.1 class C beta-lactamase-related serine hydrolase [Corynebacterium sp. SY003]